MTKDPAQKPISGARLSEMFQALELAILREMQSGTKYFEFSLQGKVEQGEVHNRYEVTITGRRETKA